MEKIKKIAYKGNEYEFEGSGDGDMRLVELSEGFILLKKVSPDIVTVFLNTRLNNSAINASGDFAGFEGYTKIVMSDSSYNRNISIDLDVRSTDIKISLLTGFAVPGSSCAGIYRVGSTK